MQNRQFDEDKAELEAHFAERVRAYIELGETQDQAETSAREKFGDTQTVLRELRRQQVRKHPVVTGIQAGLLWLMGYLPLALPTHAAFAMWEHSRQNLGEPGVPLYLWVTIEAVLAFLPACFSVALLRKRFLRNSRAIALGILLASLIGAPVHDPLTALLTILPAGIGPLACITLLRSRKRFRQSPLGL